MSCRICGDEPEAHSADPLLYQPGRARCGECGRLVIIKKQPGSIDPETVLARGIIRPTTPREDRFESALEQVMPKYRRRLQRTYVAVHPDGDTRYLTGHTLAAYVVLWKHEMANAGYRIWEEWA